PLGVIAGMSPLVLAVPLLAQIGSAATTDAASEARPAFGQQSVQDLIARDQAFLAHIDEIMALQKSAVQAHLTALTAAASLTDETAQREAVRQANEAQRETIQSALAENEDLQSTMMPFGRGGPGFGGRGGHGRGPCPEKLAEELGMTQDELKAALDSGKTIQDLAQEKGVTLPTPPERGEGPMHGRFGAQSSSAE
ncbi:MAG: hypothetical protein PHI23_05005, partial [Candidatus Peribacteraceae bacterium]|nr:hypothetical protein [Candidatus Peribacteraceae bacterium]